MENLEENLTPTPEKSKIIQPINKDSVHKICSGQVILTLAIAVKELIENAIDANATVIEINLKEYGSESIEVIDNGTGVEEQNFEGLALKYHTSKIRSFSDVLTISTFGFRGEALSSLCAVSDVVICTRHKNSNCGTKLEYDYRGVIKERTLCAREIGTTVTLKNLFSPLPVRYKEFHRNLKREYAKMCNILYAYCLISENVKIICKNHTKNGSKTNIVSTQSTSNLRDNISCVFGAKQLESLIKINQIDPTEEILLEYGIKDISGIQNPFVLDGYISNCEHGVGRSTTDRQFYFVNTRPCEPTKLIKLVNEIYRHYNSHQYPFILLNIKVEQLNVDVNVTPDKRKVFLNHEKLLLSIVKSSLLKLFQKVPSTFTMQNMSLINRTITEAEETSDSSSKKSKSEELTNFLSQWKKSDEKKEKTKNDENPKTENKNTKRPSEKSPSGMMKKFLQKRLKIDDNFSQDLSEQSSDDDSEMVKKTTKNNTYKVEILDTNHTDINNTKKQSVDDTLDENEIKACKLKSKQTECVFTIEKQEKPDENGEALSQSLSQIDASSCEIEECVIPERDFVTVNVTLDAIRESVQKKRTEAKKKEREARAVKFKSEINPRANKSAEEELTKEISQDKFAKMKIIGQFNLGFIIAQLDHDLFIIDQHASDEKYNFETLQKTTVLENQKLVIPKLLQITPSSVAVLEENIEIFRKNGFNFDIKDDEKKQVYLTTIPVSKNWHFGKDDIDEMLFMLQDSPLQMCRPSRVRMMFASRACRKSFMIGTALTKQNMRQIIDHMGEIEQPWNCPHGRPTMRHLINLSLINDDC